MVCTLEISAFPYQPPEQKEGEDFFTYAQRKAISFANEYANEYCKPHSKKWYAYYWGVMNGHGYFPYCPGFH